MKSIARRLWMTCAGVSARSAAAKNAHRSPLEETPGDEKHQQDVDHADDGGGEPNHLLGQRQHLQEQRRDVDQDGMKPDVLADARISK